MGSAAVNQITIWEQKYYDITELYALNEELLATVEKATDPEAQLALIAALVETMGESADILTDEYVSLCQSIPANRSKSRSKVEGSLRKIYMAIHDFNGRAARDAKNMAHFIVKKIKRQLEQVIANFLEFLVLSLDRIMQKHDVEELNAHHASIASMLHQHQQANKRGD